MLPTYVVAFVVELPIWALLFYLRPDLRHKMIYMGFLTALVGLTDPLFIPQYYNPIYFDKTIFLKTDIFVLLFSFLFAGIASVLYEEIMRRKVRKSYKHPLLRYFILIGPIIFIFLHHSTNLNTIFDLLIATLSMLIVVLLSRKDLFLDALLSGLFMGILYSALLGIFIFIFPDQLKIWNFKSFPQILVINIPHVEIIWGFITGAFLGPFYEFSHNLIVVRIGRK